METESRETPTETVKFKTTILDIEQNEVPVKITYSFNYKERESMRKQILEWDFEGETINLKDFDLKMLNEDIKQKITEHIGDRFYDFVD